MINMTVAPPREGLPPCIRQAVCDERVATLYDARCECSKGFSVITRYCVVAGPLSRYSEAASHPNTRLARVCDTVLHFDTDSASEAEAAWARAEQWVRTGELP
jgi:hypothetical protein